MKNLVLCFLTLLAMSSCLTISDSSTAEVTTTEAPAELLIMEEEEKLDDPDSEHKDQQAEEQDSAKNKRTLEGFLGYGYNDISGGASGIRFNRQLTDHGKVRAYYTQPSPQHSYRYYSGQLARGAVPQEEYGARAQTLQVEGQQHRPYNTISLPHNNDIGIPPEYFTKAAYQQQQYQPTSPQTSPVFNTAPHNTGAFYTLPALASPHFFPTANPFLTLASGHNFLLPHSGSTGLALLQNPTNPYGAQIIPVIILRIAPGVEHPTLQHQQQQSAAFLQGPAGFNLLYQQPHRVHENPQQSSNQNHHQQQHVIYQDNPKAHYILTSQKTVYKKPAVPTQAPATVTQKPRKNIIVVNEQPESHSEAPYSQYKYGSYKEKA